MLANTMRPLLVLSAAFVAVGHKGMVSHDHGIGKLRSLLKHFREEYNKAAVPSPVELISDDAYNKRMAFKNEVDSYDIEI